MRFEGDKLTDMWATKTPQQAFEILSKPDVSVTNESDKQMQLPKILAIDRRVVEMLR